MNEETQGSICPGCGEPVTCGAARGESTCWCAELPARMPLPGEAGGVCYCRRCLETRLKPIEPASRA